MPTSDLRSPTSDAEVLVRVDHVSKKFCRSLKRSMWYGMQDMVKEVLPFGRNGEQRTEMVDGRREFGDSAGNGEAATPNFHLATSSEASLRKDEFWAVKDVSFELRRGECLGLIGHNGAGKTTLLKMLNGLIKPDHGRIEIRGRVGALIALGAGFNPILTGRENIYVNGSVLGLTKKDVDRKLEEIIDFAGIAESIDTPVQSYSSGMNVRLGFAVAAKLINPDILFLDEVLAVGDRTFRTKCLNAVGEMTQKAAVVFVSHSMPQVGRICNQVMLMDHGMVRYQGMDVTQGIDAYLTEFESASERDSGTGEARIISIEALDEAGRGRSENLVESGAPLRIRLELEVDSRIQRVRLGAIFWNQEMRPVAELVQKNGHNAVIDVPTDSKMTCVLSVPSLPLSPGNYSLVIALADPSSGKIYLRRDNALPFQIKTHKPCWADVLLPCDVSLE